MFAWSTSLVLTLACILTHVGVFLCILTHHEAVMKQVSCYHLIIAWRIQIRQCSSFVNWVYKFMHMNAS
jgi:hypothetical protein